MRGWKRWSAYVGLVVPALVVIAAPPGGAGARAAATARAGCWWRAPAPGSSPWTPRTTGGPYRGTVLAEDVTRGRYRVRVEADGPWSLCHRQPDPAAGGPGILRTFSGGGAEVFPVRAPEDLTPIVAARHGGDGNFIVTLVAYGDQVSGRELLFNEIGADRGETLTAVPGGTPAPVIADGPWSVRFRR